MTSSDVSPHKSPNHALHEWRPRHAAWQFGSHGGAAIGELIVGSAWLFSTVAFGWPSHQLPVLGGAFVLPMCFVVGLAVFAFAIVALRRQRDWRLAAAALLGFMGVALFAVSFLIAAGGAGK